MWFGTMNKISPQKKQHILIVGASSLVIAGLLFQFGVMSKKDSIQDEEARRDEAQAKLDDGDKWIKLSKIIQTSFEENKQKLSVLETSMVPVNKNDWKVWLHTRLRDVQIRQRHDVQLGEITLDPPYDICADLLPKVPFAAARFRVPITAYYGDLGKFIADVENKFPYLRIENLNISVAPTVGLAALEGETSPALEKKQAPPKNERLVATMHMVSLVAIGAGP